MNLTMHHTRPLTLPDIARFLSGTDSLAFRAADRAQAYAWVEETLRAAGYQRLTKREKGLVRAYLIRLTGYSRAWVNVLIGRFRISARLRPKPYARHAFPRTYTLADIELLARVDRAHQRLSGPATKVILKRGYERFGAPEYERLSRISNGHLYNLRGSARYRETAPAYVKTRPSSASIGARTTPRPAGRPGYLRVDSVHQGDPRPDDRGVYHVNLVDEVTQWEVVTCVEAISERFLAPALELILAQLPFVLHGFHSDNGSEFINRVVADILERLHVGQTKSRPRHSGDNGLAETKNGAVIRKHLGFGHIPARYAPLVDAFYREAFNSYLNYHRPCAFAKETVDGRGKRIRTYPHEDYQVPYEKLRSLTDAGQYLREGVTFAELDRTAYAQPDTECATRMQETKARLFDELRKHT